jgi:hypothetical protein
LQVRIAAPKTLHDRLILIDGHQAWAVGQSFNALATRAPTSLVRVDADTSKMKIEAYTPIWEAARPV